MNKTHNLVAAFVGVLALAFFIIYTNVGSSLSSVTDVRPQSSGANVSLSVAELLESYNGELTALDEIIGDGDVALRGDTVSVHYTGMLEDGEVFDSSYLRGLPFEFTIGAGTVIQGWELGFEGMKVGGKRILVVPAALAYGNQSVGGIPANSILIFEVALLGIK
jgi:FKBP-type peptidyl-prolyl cis-trans isomerase